MSPPTYTAVVRDYLKVKEEVPEQLLFYQIGEFYELLFEDAEKASELLSLTLTSRKQPGGNRVPMAGVPVGHIDTHLARLARRGHGAAICEQTGRPTTERQPLEREITRIITAGTMLEDELIDGAKARALAGVHRTGDGAYGIAVLEISTGAFWVAEGAGDLELGSEIERIDPVEILIEEDALRPGGWAAVQPQMNGRNLTARPPWLFDEPSARKILTAHFGTRDLQGFGCEHLDLAIGAAGCVLEYTRLTRRTDMTQIAGLRVDEPGTRLAIDAVSRRNLEIGRSASGDDTRSLIGMLDSTRTAMGSRCVREWINGPVRDHQVLRARHDVIDAYRNDGSWEDTREGLKGVADLERLAARLALQRISPSDLRKTVQALQAVPGIRAGLEGLATTLSGQIAQAMDPVEELQQAVLNALEEPGHAGRIIARGYDEELDRLRDTDTTGTGALTRFQDEQIARTGIPGLRVRTHKTRGYCVEVPRASRASIPEAYTSVQSLKHTERYTCPELVRIETQARSARDTVSEHEQAVFAGLVETVSGEHPRVRATSLAIAQADALSSLAERASELNLARPRLTDDERIVVRKGRHLVVEQLASEGFIANDLELDDKRMVVVTGPNMGGKSTYLRQTGQIVLLAHTGSFVPAEQATIGLVDRIFTRIGAQDDLAEGRSTFMVEMEESANILNNATARSLVLMDEIGRGTSTYDGLALAWASAVHLAREIGAFTLFATHYFELTALEKLHPRVMNAHVKAAEHENGVVLLYQVEPGPASRSYGIEVARQAGMPPGVLDLARRTLRWLESRRTGARRAGEDKC